MSKNRKPSKKSSTNSAAIEREAEYVAATTAPAPTAAGTAASLISVHGRENAMEAAAALTGSREVAEEVQRQLAATPAPAAGKPKRERKARNQGACSLAELNALLQATGLPLTEKSSSHWGDIKGTRLVVPKGERVVRLYAYKLEAPQVIGYHTPEQRKEKGLGAVTHIADVTDMAQVRQIVDAVVVANGLGARQMELPAPQTGASEGPAATPEAPAKGTKGRRSKKAAEGTTGTEGGK